VPAVGPSGLSGGGGFDVEEVAGVIREALPGFAVEVSGHIDALVFELHYLVGNELLTAALQ